MSKRFECHAHTHYSNIRLIDAICRPKELIETAYNLGYSGIAITDHEALCGHVDWLKAEKELKEAEKISKNFKCALGNEIYLVEDRETTTQYFHFILIAKNTEGHKALRELSTIAWQNMSVKRGMERVPVTYAELRQVVLKYPGTLIATTACLGGQMAKCTLSLIEQEKRKNNNDNIYNVKTEIKKFLDYCLDLFGEDFYIEIAPSLSEEQIEYNERVIEIADNLNIKIVLGCDAHYYTAADREIHKAFLNSKEGEREVDDFYYYAHLMSNEEAYNNLKEYVTKEKFDEFCANSIEIKDKIGEYNIFHKPIIPQVKVKDYPKNNFNIKEYPILESLIDSDNIQERYWANQCLEALEQKKLWNEEYLSRLQEEADILKTISDKLENCMFEYFNTFQHYIDLFWECGSIVGPGRGSSSCFLSNYLLGIVQLDAIKWKLPAFRFLNKERVELPDIDIDISAAKRPKILEAIRKERGEFNVVQVATFGTNTSRAAIKCGARGYRSKAYPKGIDIDTANYLSSLVPSERGMTWTIDEMVNGNDEKGRNPNREFLNEMAKYPGLLEIVQSVEGLIVRRGQHASGVMLYNNSPTETNALMRSPNGDITTQFDLHDSEELGDTKFDYLITEVCDKEIECINLLKEAGYFSKNKSLREIYNENLHPEVINLDNPKIWNQIDSNTIFSLFQFDSPVGKQGITQVQPKNIPQLLMTNALIRLAGEKGKERPMDRYVRMKSNINEWYQEMEQWGLTEEEKKILEPYYLPYYGTPTTQESLMLISMDKDVSNFSLKEANSARKTVAKKKIKDIPILKEKFLKSCKREIFGEYVWETCFLPQMSYAFALPHATAYSIIGYQVAYLATIYPRIFWNCACLIVDSGGNIEVVLNDDDEEEEEENSKKKSSTTNYGKIAKAIGRMKTEGISISAPDINKSLFTFVPDEQHNTIRFGLSGITRMNKDLIQEIILKRPFTSLQDFLTRIKINKLQMTSLIKSGAFDEFGDRVEIMQQYIDSVCEKKKRLTLQNMKMLIDFGLLPKELDYEIRVYNFNKYLKKFKYKDYYVFDENSMRFYEKNYDMDEVKYINNSDVIIQKTWDKIYKKEMDTVRDYIKIHNTELLNSINQKLFNDMWEKYCLGSLSKWEMDSVSYYSHDHELINCDLNKYGCVDFNELPENPEIDRIFPKGDKYIRMYKINRIAGTILDKDKIKGTIDLLTTSGVVTVKIFKKVFAIYDKQISEVDSQGKKHVIEKSMLARGNKIIITGIRQGDDFIAKKYKNTPYHLLEQIVKIDGKEVVLKHRSLEE